MHTEKQILAVAQKIHAEVAYTIKITGNANCPKLRGIRISGIDTSEMLKFAREHRDEFSAAFCIQDQETGCYHAMNDDDAWSAFRMAFPFDDMDYRHIGKRLKNA